MGFYEQDWMIVGLLSRNLTAFDNENHPVETEKHRNQTSIFGFKMFVFLGRTLQGTITYPTFGKGKSSSN